MKIAITGGAGFIGSQLALNLQDKHEILIIDKMRSSATFENGNLQSFGHFKIYSILMVSFLWVILMMKRF